MGGGVWWAGCQSEESGPRGCKESDTTEATKTFTFAIVLSLLRTGVITLYQFATDLIILLF